MIYLSHYILMECVIGGGILDNNTWPICRKCDLGQLLPLSDFGSQGASIHYKAWVCTDPECGFNLKIRNGEVHLNEPILEGHLRERRDRRD